MPLLFNPIDWIYPPKCIVCAKIISVDSPCRRLWMCEACETLFEPIAPPVCRHCGRPVSEDCVLCALCQGKETHFDCNRAGFLYEDLIRDLIHEMKFKNKKVTAVGLGRLWAKTCGDCFSFDLLAPVPLHRKKLRARGFNQALLMARALSEKMNTPVVPDLLLRVRNTPPQSGLNFIQRKENVSGAFRLNEKYKVKQKRICLIDDIYTTGASLNACSKVLLDYKAAQVSCMTLTVTVKNKIARK